MNEWINEWMNERIFNEWMNEWTNEWMNERVNETEWMNAWMKEMNEWIKFADLIFQKWSNFLALRFLCETELLLQSCALFVNNFCRSRPAPPETETLLWRPRKPLYLKKCRVSRPRAFSNLNSGVPEMFHFPTTWWWCGWHDGENAGHDNRP